MPKKHTSWGHVAGWYNDMLESETGTFQKEVILPNIIRILSPKKGDRIVDVACGQGYFAREFAARGASVLGVDVAPELIQLAKTHALAAPAQGDLKFQVAPSHEISGFRDGVADAVTIILAIQNIELLQETFKEMARMIRPHGRLLLVMNHPAFRIPKASSWGWDEDGHTEYRRIDKYLSESTVAIDMHPGQKNSASTLSFHRPLQVYTKAITKAGFAITRIEEWISHRPGPHGRKFDALEQARKEIPLFLFLEARNIPDILSK